METAGIVRRISYSVPASKVVVSFERLQGSTSKVDSPTPEVRPRLSVDIGTDEGDHPKRFVRDTIARRKAQCGTDNPYRYHRRHN
jgi:hypothetical protein